VITTKSQIELEIMQRANEIVLKVLREIRDRVRPGMTTEDLDRYAARRLKEEGARSAFLGYRGYPKVLCCAVNDEIVHGIPSPERVLREGDILGLDFGAVVDGFVGDAAMTVPVGEIGEEARRLLRVTEEALACGIAACRPGNRVSDISRAVQERVEREGFSVVREFVGHGIGTRMHEDPPVPNFVMPGRDVRLVPGMVLAIEPMVNAGGPEAVIGEDRWTASTADGSLSAHFERSVAVTADGPRVLGEPVVPAGARAR
jgi:methionyl aminopeptidase